MGCSARIARWKRLVVALVAATAVAAAGVPIISAPPAAAQGSASATIEDPESGALLEVTLLGGSITRSEPDGWEHRMEGTARPGETVSLAVSGHGTTWTGRHHVNEDLDAALSVWFDDTDVRDDLVLLPGQSGSLAVSLTVPGDARTVDAVAIVSGAWINPHGGGSRSLIVRVRLEVVEPATVPPATRPPAPVVVPTVPADCDEFPNRAGAYATSGVRFGDLHGEVNVRPNCADDDAYIFAELSTGLMHDDRIRTSARSGAILSFSDMATFVMGESSMVVLDVVSPRESKIALSLGTVWTNFQNMIDGRGMDVEMSQAIAGARGTTFVVEETGSASTVKVFEGIVEMQPNTGGRVDVGPGEMLVVTAEGAGPVMAFDMTDELARWDDEVQRMTVEAMESAVAEPEEPATDGSARPALLAVAAVLVLIAGVAFLARQNRHRPRPLPPPTWPAPSVDR